MTAKLTRQTLTPTFPGTYTGRDGANRLWFVSRADRDRSVDGKAWVLRALARDFGGVEQPLMGAATLDEAAVILRGQR